MALVFVPWWQTYAQALVNQQYFITIEEEVKIGELRIIIFADRNTVYVNIKGAYQVTM